MLEQERKSITELEKLIENLNEPRLLLIQNAAEVLLIQQRMEEQARKEVV